MEQTLTEQMTQLRKDVVNAIMSGDRTKAYGMIDVCYASDDGGYMADSLALITDEREVYFISEDYVYDSSYDYKEDEDEITFGPYDIDSISIHSLVNIAIVITGNEHFSTRLSDISLKEMAIMNKVNNFVQIPPTEILIEYDCNWRYITVEKVSSNLLKLKNKTLCLDDPMLVIDDEEMLKIADAINSVI